jgi:hypothetical protein
MCLCEIHSPTLTVQHAKSCVINGGKENIISETDDIIRQIRYDVLLHSYTAPSSFIVLIYGRLLQAGVKILGQILELLFHICEVPKNFGLRTEYSA